MKRTFREKGLSLLESLIALLIFSIGTLAFIAMYARSIVTASDAQFRIEASNYANELIQTVYSTVARDNGNAVIAADLKRFAFENAEGGECKREEDGKLTWAGGDTAPLAIRDWICRIQLSPNALPGATKQGAQKIVIQTDPTDFNRVVVTLRWTVPSEGVNHSHDVIAHIN